MKTHGDVFESVVTIHDAEGFWQWEFYFGESHGAVHV